MPAVVYVWVGVAPVPVLPSPKVPGVSEARRLYRRAHIRRAGREAHRRSAYAGGSVNVTVGATSLTVTVVLELPLCPAESVAVSVAVYVPGLA